MADRRLGSLVLLLPYLRPYASRAVGASLALLVAAVSGVRTGRDCTCVCAMAGVTIPVPASSASSNIVLSVMICPT